MRDEARIRAATLADAAEILRLEALFPSDRMSAQSVRRFLKSRSARVWVAESHGQVMGNLVLLSRRGSKCARIYSVIVDPAARGMGLGHRLVEAAERAARKLGLQRVTLEVRADNLAARALYEHRGYVIEARLTAYYDDGADGLKLGRQL